MTPWHAGIALSPPASNTPPTTRKHALAATTFAPAVAGQNLPRCASKTEEQGMNEQLQSIVDRIERLESDKAEIASDIKDVYAEAKAGGYDTKVLREVIRIRKQDKAKRAEFEAVLELYREALGDLKDTPLGEAAVRGFGAIGGMQGALA
jgi:uncharacterized protein (UPF0335 family)